MKSNFNKCCDLLLKDEGGYSNDPDDNGGATNFGITIVDYRKYLNKNGTPNDVKNMKVADARVIYKSKYWDALNCDSLSSGVDYTVFDYGANSGLKRPKDDLIKFKDLSGNKLIDAINDERQAFLNTISNPDSPKYSHNSKYRKGWTNRVTRVRGYSHVLSTNKDTSTGAITGAGTLGVFATLSQYFHQHQTAIIIGGLVAAVIIGTIVHMVRNRKQ